MAFQIVDDLLDYIGARSDTGKPTGPDLREHKVTLPLIAALPAHGWGRAARGGPADGRRGADRRPDRPGGRTGGGCRRPGLRPGTRPGFAQRAESELDSLSPSPARDALRASVTYVLERRR